MSGGNGALPKGWEPVKVGDIVQFNYGKALSAKKRDNTGFPVYGSNGVIGQHSQPLLQGPALLVGRKGSIGEVHLCDGPCSAIDTTYFVDQFYGQPIQYWYYRLKSLPLADLNRATALPGLNRQDAYDLDISLPPLAEQRRIVSKIESLQARSSRAREALSEVGPLLEQFRQSVLRAAFSGRLTADWRAAHGDVEPATELLSRIRTERRHRWEQSELAKYVAKGKQPPKNWQDKYKEPAPVDESELPCLPESWAWTTIAEIASPNRHSLSSGPFGSNLGKKDYVEAGIPVIRGKNITEGTISGEFVYVTKHKATELERSTARPDDVVLIAVGSSGRPATVPADLSHAVLSQNCNKVTCDPDLIESNYVTLYLQSNLAQRLIGLDTTDTVRKFFSLTNFKKISVPLPPRAEQLAILKTLEEVIESEAVVEAERAESEFALTQLDQSILAKAFRGELVPQDPRDEPASELLERIRATREANHIANKKYKARKTRKLKTNES